MKYTGMPLGMWVLFSNSFRKQLTTVLKYDGEAAKRITAAAKPKYKEIISKLPEFEREDQFKMNIVNCAMFSAFLLSMHRKPTVEEMTKYYSSAMMIAPTRWFCRMAGKAKFSKKDILQMQKTAALKAADRNPYSWNMEYLPYTDGNGYEARFTKCGICTLMKELGLFQYTPAMCRLDYDMSKAGGASQFVRRYTLASGGPYCDCGYIKRN